MSQTTDVKVLSRDAKIEALVSVMTESEVNFGHFLLICMTVGQYVDPDTFMDRHPHALRFVCLHLGN